MGPRRIEPRPRPKTTAVGLEQRAEKRFFGESAKAALAGLFALTTQGCSVCFDIEHDIMERQVAAEQDQLARERAAEKPEVKARREFKAKLVELEKAGYSVEISGINVVGDASGAITAETLSDMASLKDDLTYGENGARIIETAASPLEYLQQQLDKQKPHTTSVHVPIYRISMKPDKAGLNLTVENWLTDKTVTTVTIETLSTTTADYADWESKRQTALAKMLAAIRQDKESLAEIYGKLLTDNHISINAMDMMRVHPGHGMENMADLFANKDFSYVEINGFKHDSRALSSPFISWTFRASEAAEMQRTGSPELPGTLTSVEMRRGEWDTVPDWWHGKATSEVYKDKYGNLIMIETSSGTKDYEHAGEQDETYSQTIAIMVPTNFLDAAGSETEAMNWSVDLSKLGIPEMTDFAYSHPERPVRTKTTDLGFKFNLYYQGEDAQTNNVYDGFFDTATRGSLEMQYAFYGYDADEQLTTNILVVPTNGEKNGFFTARNSATIALTDVHMDISETSYDEVESTARHETSHALFNHLQLNNSQPFNELHKRLSPDFFKAIAEANWEKNGFGGHPQDNTTELFASFMNGLMVDDLETTMRAKLTPATAAEYAETAKILREVLSKPLKTQNDRFEPIDILEKLTKAEGLARQIAAGE